MKILNLLYIFFKIILNREKLHAETDPHKKNDGEARWTYLILFLRKFQWIILHKITSNKALSLELNFWIILLLESFSFECSLNYSIYSSITIIFFF